MPELVEAEVCATQLNVAMWRATVVEIGAADKQLDDRLRHLLVGWTSTGVVRVGNAVLFEFENPGAGSRFILTRFGSAGSWRLGPHPSSCRLTMKLFGPAREPIELAFVEGRRAVGASVEVSDSLLDLPYIRFVATCHDVMSDKFDDEWLGLCFARCPPAMTVREALVRQEFFPGIGPWIANESLFRAKLHPDCRARDLDRRQLADLARGIIMVVSSSVILKGTAIGSWRNPDGSRGLAQDEFCVHGRSKCAMCRSEIKRNGAAHWCDVCQPLN